MTLTKNDQLKVLRNNLQKKLLSQSSGFTLIEMLVVIAIIGILASMLMPSLQSALDSGRQVICLNNLKSMTLAGNVYTNSYDGYFVPAQSQTSTGLTAWYAINEFRESIGITDNTPLNATIWPVGNLCPKADYAHSITTNNIMYSYGMIINDIQDLFTSGASCKAYRINKVLRPSKKMVFSDSFDWIVLYAIDNTPDNATGYWTYLEENVSGRPHCRTAFRHNSLNAANAAFFDGHAEAVDWNKLTSFAEVDIWRAYH